jgi:hypothetical protein
MVTDRHEIDNAHVSGGRSNVHLHDQGVILIPSFFTDHGADRRERPATIFRVAKQRCEAGFIVVSRPARPVD